jgi:hypothetical protein
MSTVPYERLYIPLCGIFIYLMLDIDHIYFTLMVKVLCGGGEFLHMNWSVKIVFLRQLKICC